MSTLAQQAYNLMLDMPDESARFVIDMIRRVKMLPVVPETGKQVSSLEQKKRAFAEMEELRKESYLYMDGFDPEQELLEALDEKYGRFD